METNNDKSLALRTSLIYAAIAGAWILFSDLALEFLIPDAHTVSNIQTYKGCAFVAFTAALLYLTLRHQLQRRSRETAKRREAEETVRKLSHAVEQSPVSVVITDTSGAIEYVNRKFTQITGYSLEEVRGKNSRILKSGELSPDEYKLLWSTIAAGGTWSGEFHNRKKTGETFWESATIAPILNGGGNITHFVAVKEDITRRKQLEEQFRQAQKMEALGQLAGGVAHDFNNILTAIQMETGLLQADKTLSPGQLSLIREIQGAADRAARLTQQLLAFSRSHVVQFQDLDLNDAVSNLSKMLRRVLGENIHMQVNCSEENLVVHADEGMLDQVVMNLAVNARDAMSNGGQLSIETAAVELDDVAAAQMSGARPGAFAVLNITDTGGGIPPEILPRIFEVFFTTKDPGKGTGLGLATVSGIVQQHNGWINVASEVGKGTRFSVYFPRVAKPAMVPELAER